MRHGLLAATGLVACFVSGFAWPAQGAEGSAAKLDRILASENEGRNLKVAAQVDDLGFLRRISVDVIGRIPTSEEIDEYLSLPADERRVQAIDRLLADERFADRWTVFFADMLRLRSQANGGAALTAYVHKAIEQSMPYDTLCQQLLSASGKAGKVPEVGFILGDQADPMALAAATAQVFMGIRISCAQCHNHPFDVWKREQFYGLAAYFGKTRRVESNLTKAVYTTETDQTAVLWPPEGMAAEGDRKPMKPAFPFDLEPSEPLPEYINRLTNLRQTQAARLAQSSRPKEASVDDLLDDAASKAQASLNKTTPVAFDVADEAKQEARKLKVDQDLYRASQLRQELAQMVTSPRNRFFSRNLVNRLWAELLGRGFVEPVDDFSNANAPSHPQTLDYLADEFVASGFDLRSTIRSIVTSEAYQRGHLFGVDDAVRQEAEEAFTAAPIRRMLAESMFDSMVLAGHLSEAKYPAGENMKTVRAIVQVPVKREGAAGKLLGGKKAAGKSAMAGMQAMAKPVVQTGYDLEASIEVDFDKVLREQQQDAPEVEEMTAMSAEELEAQMMEKDRDMRYIERVVETTVDDNPVFSSAMRMASPALPNHFLRVFGQPSRDSLGEHRDSSPSMRQELMMLNGRLTHEASRVGPFEPIFKLLLGKNADLSAAISMAYREILTREPSAEELTNARQILEEAESPRDGMADLRWALFNCHEFRFLP